VAKGSSIILPVIGVFLWYGRKYKKEKPVKVIDEK